MEKNKKREESTKLNESSSKNKDINTAKDKDKKSNKNIFNTILKGPNFKKNKKIFQKINKKSNELNIIKSKDQKNIETKKKRHYGIDIARILAMYFIVNLHIIFHGGIMSQMKLLFRENNLFIYFETILCSGVDIFGMISGFVGFHSHKYSNLIYLLIQTFSYNYGIAYYFKVTKPSYVQDLNHFLYPLFISDYWYFTAYFIVYFFFPLINAGIKYIGKREIGIFNLTLFLFFSCFNQIQHYSKILKKDIFDFHNGFTYKWLLILYFLGGYFGRFYSESHKHNKFIILILCSVVIALAAYYRNLLLINKIKNKDHFYSMTFEYTAPSSVIIAACFILFFSKLDINSIIFQKIISFFAPLTFGIYLIHEHKIVRGRIIKGNYKFLLKYKSKELILGILSESSKIFLFCSVIDFIRLLIFKIFRIRQICILIETLITKILNFILIIFEYLY